MRSRLCEVGATLTWLLLPVRLTVRAPVVASTFTAALPAPAVRVVVEPFWVPLTLYTSAPRLPSRVRFRWLWPEKLTRVKPARVREEALRVYVRLDEFPLSSRAR